jgi:hypothetical protein
MVGLCAMLAAASAVSAQHNVQTPPLKGEPIVLPERAPQYVPGQHVDPETGAILEWGLPVAPVMVPVGGVFPHGTLPDPEREASRPMRPGGDPWIPNGTGYWPPVMEDQAADGGQRAQALMQDFAGPGPNGLTPPDPDLARGYDYVVAATNDDFGVYDSCGNEVFYSDINDFLGMSGHFLFDPKVIFDPWGQRWVLMYHNRDDSPQLSELVIYVTSDSNPPGLTSGWFYRFNTLQDAGTGDASWADYFDLGYSNTQLFASGNMFRFAGGFRWGRLMFFNKADIYAAQSAGYLWWHGLTNGDGSTTDTPRSAKQQASWSEGGLNIDGTFVNSRWGGGDRITFWKASDVFGANNLTKNDTGVGNYTTPPDAVQPSGESLDTIDCRLMTAVVTTDGRNGNGIELFTSLTAASGSDARILLYKFDAVSRALEFESLFGATGFDYWFASSAADYTGSNFWVFSRTANSAGNEPEIRFVDLDQGTFSSSSTLVRDGDGSFNGFRWGDYFGGQLDWGDYSANGGTGSANKVWLYGEFGRNDSWGTHVGATSVDAQGSMSGVSPSTTYVISGPPGGPFSPASRTYTLQSAAGDTGVAFQVTSLPSWLSASRTYGQLWGDTTVNLSVNSNANGLAAGTYTDNVFFTDCYNGGSSYTRAIELRVEATDLQVVSVDVTNGAYNPGDAPSISGQFRNNGNLATGNFSADFYISTNNIISPSDTLIGSRNYSSLGGGASMNFGPHNFALPCLPEGNYYVGVIVTVNGDADTSDNVGHDATTIGYELCPGDHNGDCSVDTRDVISFLNDWNANRPSADCDGNRIIDTRDVICFLNLWTGRC